MLTIEQHAGLVPDLPDARLNAVWVNAVGHQATEPKHDGRIRTMPLAGRTQRAIEAGFDSSDLAQLPAFRQPPHKHGSRLHRANGMRRRRANANLEQVKNTQGHGRLSYLLAVVSIRRSTDCIVMSCIGAGVHETTSSKQQATEAADVRKQEGVACGS